MPTNEVEEHRRRAAEAMEEIKVDLERFRRALTESVRPAALFDRFPLAVLGAALGTGLVAGLSRGRRRAYVVAGSDGAATPPARPARSIIVQIAGAVAGAAAREGLALLAKQLEARALRTYEIGKQAAAFGQEPGLEERRAEERHAVD
jgi:hypothetical protein